MSEKPVPDGGITILSHGGEVTLRYPFAEYEFSQDRYGLLFSYERDGRKFQDVLPYHSIGRFTVEHPSPDYEKRMLVWIRDCDHDWLTHPRIGNYCRVCRLPMESMAKVEMGQDETLPPLVATDEDLDEVADKYGTGEAPAVHVVAEELDQDGAVVGKLQMDQDPRTFCSCERLYLGEQPSEPQHSGPCGLFPHTWPLRPIDDPDGTEF